MLTGCRGVSRSLARVDSRSICPPAGPGAVRSAGDSCGFARAYCCRTGGIRARKEANEPGCGRSASPSQLGDLRRSGREGRTASRPSSLREEGPRACRPPRGGSGSGSGSGGRPRLRPAGPQGYEEPEVPGLCSQEVRPGTRRLLGQGGEKLSGAESRRR